MPVLSDKRLEQIEFAEAHYPIWLSNPAGVGLALTTAQAIKVATLAARDAYNQAQASREATKAATTGFHNTTDSMKTLVADAIKTIRLFAETTHNPAVFQLAQIPMPASPTPLPPPSQPTDITANIEPDGSLTLTWRATSDGTGAVYLVKRKLPGESSFSLIGAAETARLRFKSFTDATLPVNANNIQYIIQGQRGSSVGPDSSVFVVMLGAGEGGGAGVSVQAMKIAA